MVGNVANLFYYSNYRDGIIIFFTCRLLTISHLSSNLDKQDYSSYHVEVFYRRKTYAVMVR